MQLRDSVTTGFPPLCNRFEVRIELGPSLGRFMFGEGAISQPARDGRMASSHLSSNGRLRETLLEPRHDLLVLGQPLFSLCLTHLGVFWMLFRWSFALHWRERGRS